MLSTRILTISSTIALIAASPALADLTAEQVLEDQLKQMQTYGLTAKVTSQSRAGDTLTVDGLSAAAMVPEGSLRVDIGGASFTELGDGTVRIDYPQTIPIKFAVSGVEDENVEFSMTLTHSNMQALVSGFPEQINYEFTADMASIGDVKVLSPDEAMDMNMGVTMQATNLRSVSQFSGAGSVRDYTVDFALEAFSGVFDLDVPDEGAFQFGFQGQSFTGDYSGKAAPQSLGASFAQSIQAGNETEGTASHGPLTYKFSVDGPDGILEIAAAVASGVFDVKMDRTGLDYGTTSTDMTLSVGGTAIPLPPLTFRMAESGGRLAMPVVPSDDIQNFGMGISLRGLEIDQMLWGMFDPTGQLPRDPADLVIDIEGAGTLTEDVFAPEFAEQMTGAPGELDSLNIKQILLTMAGAELTGDGAFTFQNNGPVPMPVGSINANLKGANGLLDTLVNMGLLPEEQAMGARMMMGLFARPGTGPDSLTSTIEFNEDGSVLANGQRIR